MCASSALCLSRLIVYDAPATGKPTTLAKNCHFFRRKVNCYVTFTRFLRAIQAVNMLTFYPEIYFQMGMFFCQNVCILSYLFYYS